MFERPDGSERAVLVHVDFVDSENQEDADEFRELVTSAGAQIGAFVYGKRAAPSPRLFVGKGKIDEIRAALQVADAQLVLFNHSLSPSQERNIERELCCRVLDRTGLILDIFAQRARTHEGKLQVELAQLQYLSTRLVRGWTHLERQKGGIGLRGPGETQLETDRRLLRARIKSINSRLEKVRRQRAQGRRSRERAQVPSLSLVGYTNAGKSTLFNALTDAEVLAADQLFATLDPTFRRFDVPGLGSTVLADTVGFIRHLPHKLVEAFRATLEEASQSDLLIHVVDAADDNRQENAYQVEQVLAEIGADEIPLLEVYNKTDMLAGVVPKIERDAEGRPRRVWLSARSADGLPLLSEAVADLLGDDMAQHWVVLAPHEARLRASLYEANVVMQERRHDDGGCGLHIRAPQADLIRLFQRQSVELEHYLRR